MTRKNYYRKRIKALNILTNNRLAEIIKEKECTILDLEICHYNKFGATHRKFLMEFYGIKYFSTYMKTLDFIIKYPRYSKRLMYVTTKRENQLDEIMRQEKENRAKYEQEKEFFDKLITEKEGC